MSTASVGAHADPHHEPPDVDAIDGPAAAHRTMPGAAPPGRAAGLRTACGAIYAVATGVAILGLIIIVLTISWQVIARYISGTSTAWAPELAQLTFVWTALMAIAIGVRQGKHMTMDLWDRFDSRTLKRGLNSFTTAVIVAASLVLSGASLDLLEVSFTRDFAALGIPTGWMYLAAPVGFLLCALFAIERWLVTDFGATTSPAGSTEQEED